MSAVQMKAKKYDEMGNYAKKGHEFGGASSSSRLQRRNSFTILGMSTPLHSSFFPFSVKFGLLDLIRVEKNLWDYL